MTFPGGESNCRLHGPCCGNYLNRGSVSLVRSRRIKIRSEYYVFRKFVSFLSCGALRGQNSGIVYVRRPYSCVILGSVDDLKGYVRQLTYCATVRYCLSGSRTKAITTRAVVSYCRGETVGRSVECTRCGSIGSCLVNEGSVVPRGRSMWGSGFLQEGSVFSMRGCVLHSFYMSFHAGVLRF